MNQFDATHTGFTGSRRGMTCDQLATMETQILCHITGWWHHGDCVGSDKASHALAIAHRLQTCVHPPSDSRLRAWCKGDIILEPKHYLARNCDIVDSTCRLIAAPATMDEELRSGTWYTVRFARKLGRLIIIVLPDGSVKVEKEKG